MQHNQLNNLNEPSRFHKETKLNLRNYLQFKLQLIHNLEQTSVIDDKKCARKGDMREMIIQEIDLLTGLLDKQKQKL